MGDTVTTYKHVITLLHDTEPRQIVYTTVKVSLWTQEMIWGREILPFVGHAEQWRITGFEVEQRQSKVEQKFSVRVADPADYTSEP